MYSLFNFNDFSIESFESGYRYYNLFQYAVSKNKDVFSHIYNTAIMPKN